MDVLPADGLTRLAADRGSDRFSLFMPIRRGRAGVDGNRACFNDLLQRARHVLRVGGRPTVEITTLLDNARELFDDVCPWERPRGGLALFSSPSGNRCFWLPPPVPELVTIGARFTIGPLSMVASGGHFVVLALGQDDVQLFEGTHFGLGRVALNESPLALLQTMPRSKRAPVTTCRADRGGPDREAAVFHGIGGGEENRKNLVLQHFRRINRALRETLGVEQTLVLAAAEQGRIGTLSSPRGRPGGSTLPPPRARSCSRTRRYPPGPAEYPGLAAAVPLQHAGSLLVVPAQRIPEDTPIAAVLRY